MADSKKDELDRAFDSYDARQAENKKRLEAIVQSQDTFGTQFETYCKTIVRPLLERVGERLRSRGHDFAITERAYSTGHREATIDANIEIQIFLDGNKPEYGNPMKPGFRVSGSRSQQRVHIHETTPNMSGGRGDFTFDQLKGDGLERHLTAYLVKLFGG